MALPAHVLGLSHLAVTVNHGQHWIQSHNTKEAMHVTEVFNLFLGSFLLVALSVDVVVPI